MKRRKVTTLAQSLSVYLAHVMLVLCSNVGISLFLLMSVKAILHMFALKTFLVLVRLGG